MDESLHNLFALRNRNNHPEEPMELENVLIQQHRLASLLKYKGTVPAYFRRKRHTRLKAQPSTNSSSSNLNNQQDPDENYSDPALEFLFQGLVTFREPYNEFPLSLNYDFKQKFNSPNQSFYNENNFPLNVIEEPRIKNEFKIPSLLSGEIIAAADFELGELKRRPLGSTRMSMMDKDVNSKTYSTKKKGIALSTDSKDDDNSLVKQMTADGGGYLTYRNKAYVTYDPKVAQLLDSRSPTAMDNFLPRSESDGRAAAADHQNTQVNENTETCTKNSRRSSWCICNEEDNLFSEPNFTNDEDVGGRDEHGQSCIKCGKLKNPHSNILEKQNQLHLSQSSKGADRFKSGTSDSKKEQYFLMLKKKNDRQPSWSEITIRKDHASISTNSSALLRRKREEADGHNTDYQSNNTVSRANLEVQKEQYRLAYDQAIRCHRNATFAQHLKNGENPKDFFNQRTSRVTFSYFDYLPRYARGLEIFRYANPPRDFYRERMLLKTKPTPKQLTFGDHDPDWYLPTKKDINKKV